MSLSTLETPSSAATVRGLLHQLTTQLSTLLRQELALARTELYQSLLRLLLSLGTVIGGVALLYTAFLLLVAAAVCALALLLPIWLAALSVGVIIGLIGFALVQSGRRLLKNAHLAPSHLPQSLRHDKDVLLRRARS